MTQENSNFYKVPKIWVWVCVSIFSMWLFYKVVDWATHLNWPPVDLRNQSFIKSLTQKYNCSRGDQYSVTEKKIKSDESTSTVHLGIDRNIFFDHPECNGARIYLAYEGTGIRETLYIYDRKTKQKTATIVVTHEKFDAK